MGVVSSHGGLDAYSWAPMASWDGWHCQPWVPACAGPLTQAQAFWTVIETGDSGCGPAGSGWGFLMSCHLG